MIKSLYIENFLFIKSQRLFFSNGLNVITGESGSGKSIILQAIDFLMGMAKGKEYLLDGRNGCYVEAMFELKESVLDSIKQENSFFSFLDDQIILSRRYNSNGRSSYYLDNKQVTRENVRSFRNKIIESCYRDEALTAYSSEGLRDLIDSLIEKNGKDTLFADVKNSFEEYIVLKKRIDELKKKKSDMNRRLDYLLFQKKEIEESGLLDINQNELEREYSLLANHELVSNTFSEIINLLETTDLINTLSQKKRTLDRIKNLPSEIQNIIQELEGFSTEFSDFKSSIENFLNTSEFDGQRLEILELQMAKMVEFQRKYAEDIPGLNKTYSAILDEMETLKKDLDLVDESPDLLEKLDIYNQNASKLSRERKKIAEKLMMRFLKNLSKLGLESSRSLFELTETPPSSYGSDRVTMMFSANPDTEQKPVDKIASFGEKSRIILAIKDAAKTKSSSVLLVDEIESGLGGEALLKSLEMLKSISKDIQIIAVTHNKKLAEIADSHFLVEKNTQDEKTILSINKLETKSVKKKELKRMSV